MTDFAPEASQQPLPDAGKDYEALYRQEVQARIAEREKYKPFAQAVGALDPDSRDALIALAQAAAEGDVDAIAEWTASTYRNLRGADLVNAIAQQQNGQPAPQQAPMQAPMQQAAEQQQQWLTMEQAAEIARREAERTVTTQNLANQIASELSAAGYPADSPYGKTIINYAMQTGLPISDAIAWYESDLGNMMQRRQQAGAHVMGSVPMPSPTGAPSASSIPVTASPREKALARLNAANRQPGQ